jgi:hypothetical protein
VARAWAQWVTKQDTKYKREYKRVIQSRICVEFLDQNGEGKSENDCIVLGYEVQPSKVKKETRLEYKMN